MTIAYLEWSVDVECPACGECFDLAKDDDDHIVGNAIFGDKREDLVGYEAVCPECSHEFLISEIQH